MKLPMVALNALQLEAVRKDWDMGILPPQTISAKHNVDHTDLREFANANGWEGSELTRLVSRETARAIVERTVAIDDAAQGRLEPRVMSDTDTARQFATILAAVNTEHQGLLARARRHSERLLTDLESISGPDVDRAALEGLASTIQADNPELAKLLRGIPEPVPIKERIRLLQIRSTILEQLSRTMSGFIKLEREVLDITKGGKGGSLGYDELLQRMHEIEGQQLRRIV